MKRHIEFDREKVSPREAQMIDAIARAHLAWRFASLENAASIRGTPPDPASVSKVIENAITLLTLDLPDLNFRRA